MKMSEELEAIKQHIEAIQQVLDSLTERLRHVDKSWPDKQVVGCSDWHDRSETPPEGKIWASNGIRVWLINSDGKAIPAEATAIKFWSLAYLPSPPLA